MKRRRWNARRPMPAGELFADDLQSAEEVFRKSSHPKTDRKAQQLCRQVQRTLGLVLAGSADPLLRELMIDSVVPMPDAKRLMVNVYSPTQHGPAGTEGSADAGLAPDNCESHLSDDAEILEHLDRFRGALRRDVAQAITRKRAPELVFRVIRPGEVLP